MICVSSSHARTERFLTGRRFLTPWPRRGERKDSANKVGHGFSSCKANIPPIHGHNCQDLTPKRPGSREPGLFLPVGNVAAFTGVVCREGDRLKICPRGRDGQRQNAVEVHRPRGLNAVCAFCPLYPYRTDETESVVLLRSAGYPVSESKAVCAFCPL